MRLDQDEIISNAFTNNSIRGLKDTRKLYNYVDNTIK